MWIAAKERFGPSDQEPEESALATGINDGLVGSNRLTYFPTNAIAAPAPNSFKKSLLDRLLSDNI
jgi:hypothetical protein